MVFSLALGGIAPVFLWALASLVARLIEAVSRPMVLSFSIHTKNGKELIQCHPLPIPVSLAIVAAAALIFLAFKKL